MAVLVAVVADTHLPRFGRRLPGPLVAGLRESPIELVLHAGDHTAPFVADLFREALPDARFEAVAGNNDPPGLVERYGRRRIVEVAGVPIGIVHGDLGPGRTTPERAARSFGPSEVRAVVFGHSHVPLVERLPDGRLLVNPGSPTDRRRQPRCTWALLRVDPAAGTAIEVELRSFDRTRESIL